LPAATGKALSEAREASRWGLTLATVALCRLVLEDAVHSTFEECRKNEGATPAPRKDRPLRKVVDRLAKDGVLSKEEAKDVHRLLDNGIDAIHYAIATEPDAILFGTVELLTILTDRLSSSR
jgi:hypothetical protein